MANLTPSFRFPAKLPADTAHPKVIDAIEQNTNGLVDVNQAIVALNTKVSALTPATSTTASTASGGSTTVVENGVSSFNAETGGVVYFPSMGIVNNQSGVTAYTTQTQDNGAIVVLASGSAIAVTLNFNVAAPWFTTISNQGTGTVTITPSQGAINGGGSATLNAGNFSTIFFDGKNWWSDAPATGGGGGGTVTAVTGTAPIVSSGGTAPAISVMAATSSALGVVKPDNTTITVAAGVISAVGGGGGYSLGGAATTANVSLGPGAGSGASLVSVTGYDKSHSIIFTAGSGLVTGLSIYTFTYTTPRSFPACVVATDAFTVGGSGTPDYTNHGTGAPSSLSTNTGYQLLNYDANGIQTIRPGYQYQINVSCP